MKAVFVAAALASFTAVNAHGTVSGFIVNGADQGTDNVRTISSVNPVTSVSDPNMACGNGASGSAASVVEVKGGDTVGFTMKNGDGGVWVHYMGPVSYFMYPCPDATNCNPTDKQWAAVAHQGEDGSSNDWWMKRYTESQPVTFTMPNVPNGQYLVRQELAAIHNGLEFYIQCAQVKVTTGGNGTWGDGGAELVSLPGYYTGDEPGFKFNPYGAQLSTYPQPGPAVYTPAASTAPASPPPESVPVPPSSSSDTPSSSSSAPATTPTSCKAPTRRDVVPSRLFKL